MNQENANQTKDQQVQKEVLENLTLEKEEWHGKRSIIPADGDGNVVNLVRPDT